MAVPGRERAAPKLLYLYGGTESLNLSCSDSEVGLLSERLRREPPAIRRQHYRLPLRTYLPYESGLGPVIPPASNCR